jgi:hypothetical protein
MEDVKSRLQLGREKYGHGVRVDDDTVTWGTPKNSWMEMAREEFLDAIVYVTADYIRKGREDTMSKMEIDYMYTPEFEECEDPRKYLEEHRKEDDNDLILYILEHKEKMEPCYHKTLLYTLFNILDMDQLTSKVQQSV